MMKKKFHGLVLAAVAVLLTGCVKCVSTETKTVQVQVVDEYYKEAEYRFLYNGKAVVPVKAPAVYEIVVEYAGVNFTFSGEDTYQKYAEHIGEYTNATLEQRKYSDGSVRYNMIDLE